MSDDGNSYEFLAEKIDRDLRHSLEFLMRVKPMYRESDLLKKDFITYFRMLEEAEIQEQEAIARMEDRRN